jgi:hypothetical protein
MTEPEAKNKCTEVRDQLALMLYGELSFDEEEIVETHLDACTECRAALSRQRELHGAIDRLQVEPPPSLLRECRAAFEGQLTSSPVPVAKPGQQDGWWDKLVNLVTGPGPALTGWLRPAGALTLIAVGFVGARLVPVFSTMFSTGSGGFATMGLADTSAARVRNIETGANGQVQIVVDETRQRVISGGLGDQQIRTMLLTAASESADPGVRAETVELLTSDAASPEVRDMLIGRLRHDQNSGVRLKAMEGLKHVAQDPAVRRTFADVLLSDGNPGIRTQVIDLLTQGVCPSVDRDLVGALQELMVKENNPYVRERCQSVLASWNASSEIY